MSVLETPPCRSERVASQAEMALPGPRHRPLWRRRHRTRRADAGCEAFGTAIDILENGFLVVVCVVSKVIAVIVADIDIRRRAGIGIGIGIGIFKDALSGLMARGNVGGFM